MVRPWYWPEGGQAHRREPFTWIKQKTCNLVILRGLLREEINLVKVEKFIGEVRKKWQI